MKFLFFLSYVYRLGCQFKNLLYCRKILLPKKAALPVISIGNIAFGGTEKTPLAMNLISFFLENGLKPALVSRGYKGKWEKRGGMLSDGNNILGSWKDSGDEPFMVAQNIPTAGVFIGKNRLASCQRASQLGFNIVLLDDGFQHRRLHRDLDIALYSPYEKIALREPVSSLNRADILLVKKSTDRHGKKNVKQLFPRKTVFEYSVITKGFFKLGEKRRVSGDELKGKKIIGFCSIARPERFASLLQKEGVKLEFLFKFPDHHSYPPSSLEKIMKKYQKLKAEILITTEKDAVKVVDYKAFRKFLVYYSKIDLGVEENFYSETLSLLKSWG